MAEEAIIKVNLSKKSKDNLCKLATYLQSLPYAYKHFAMSTFLEMDEEGQEAVKQAYLKGEATLSRTNCQTVACAAGHGPAAGVSIADYMTRGTAPDWKTYSFEEFLMTVSGNHASPLFWSWCFGGEWNDYDNHHYGAAARIRYLLDKGGIPANFNNADYGGLTFKSMYRPYRVMERVPLIEEQKEKVDA